VSDAALKPGDEKCRMRLLREVGGCRHAFKFSGVIRNGKTEVGTERFRFILIDQENESVTFLRNFLLDSRPHSFHEAAQQCRRRSVALLNAATHRPERRIRLQ
jgi:hypothetical protein